MRTLHSLILAIAALAGLNGCGRRESTPGAAPALPSNDSPATASVAVKPQYYQRVAALCVGIDKYLSVDIPEAEAAERDAKAVAALFRERYGYQVTELTRAQATKGAIISAIDRLKSELGERDALIVYFAGHGRVIDLPSFGRAGYLIPYDADLDLKNAGRRADWDERAIDMRALAKSVEGSNAQHVVFVVDSCFSGFMTRRGLSPALGEMMARRSRCVVAATTERQSSTRDPETGLGHFSGALVNRLTVNEPVSLTDVFSRVRDDVVRSSKRSMFPQRGDFGEEDGEFVFIPLAYPSQNLQASIDYIRDRAVQRASRRTTAEELATVFDAADYRNGPKQVELEKLWEPRFERFDQNARNGDVMALAALSLCHAKGVGTPVNPREAYRCARLAFDSGRDEGLLPLWYCLHAGVGTNKNPEAATRVVLDGIKDVNRPTPYQQFARAQSTLTLCIEYRQQNDSHLIRQLLSEFQAAFDGGVGVAALRQLTCWLLLGDPIPEIDRAKLLPVVIRLAETGNPIAQYHQYHLMATGSVKLTVDQERVAFDLLRSAAEHGYAPAQIALASEQYGRKPFAGHLGLEPNCWRASMWASRAAEKGCADGYKILAMIHLFKDLPNSDRSKALVYWQNAVSLDPNDKTWAEWMKNEFEKSR